MNLRDKIKAFSTEDANGCWIWQKYRQPNGYGRSSFDGKVEYAHRAAHRAFIGPIPDGMLVMHRCDVKACVNPDHLFAGTFDQNMADMVAKGRQVKGARQHASKLTAEQVREVRTMYASGNYSQSQIAKQFNVNQHSIWCILAGHTWRHV